MAHELLVAPVTADLLAEAGEAAGGLGSWEAANLREMTRVHAHAAAVSGDLVMAESKVTSAAEMAWREARAASDFALLRPHLEVVLAAERAIAQAKGGALGLSPYDALLDQFDPGLRRGFVDPLFDRLRAELPGLLASARETQAAAGAPAANRRSVLGVGISNRTGRGLFPRHSVDHPPGAGHYHQHHQPTENRREESCVNDRPDELILRQLAVALPGPMPGGVRHERRQDHRPEAFGHAVLEQQIERRHH